MDNDLCSIGLLGESRTTMIGINTTNPNCVLGVVPTMLQRAATLERRKLECKHVVELFPGHTGRKGLYCDTPRSAQLQSLCW